MKPRMQSGKTARKVKAAAMGAATATVLIWLLKAIWPELDISTGLEGAFATIMTFIFGYFASPSADDQVI